MRIPLPTAKRRVRIEIIPLIDIVFFLLATFVMVSLSMVKNQGLSVNLPQAASSREQELKQSVTITVKERGDIYWDHAAVSFEQMSGRLRELRALDPELRVLINGDEKAHLGKVIEILDEVRSLGITKVSMRTKTPHKEE